MDLIETHDIPDAGRGVIAKVTLPAGVVVHESGPPVCHVIFRAYRREVCAQCFFYNDSRSLPVRDNDVDKSYCSQVCREQWIQEQQESGVQLWRSLATFVRARSKSSNDSTISAGHDHPPSVEEIEAAWERAENESISIRLRNTTDRLVPTLGKNSRLHSHPATQASFQPDLLSYLLSGIQTYNRSPEEWTREVLSLAMDDTPYRSVGELADHCAASVQLASILPPALFEKLPTQFCRSMANADSHNAFGLNSGSEDLEEHTGYAVYPSASYFNHSCAPNISKIRKGRSWTFMTSQEVRAGEQCCITYLGGDEKSMSVVARRKRLSSIWGFVCGCKRCATESKNSSVTE